MITYIYQGNCSALGCNRVARFVVDSAAICDHHMEAYNKGRSVSCNVWRVAGGNPQSPSLLAQPVLLKRELLPLPSTLTVDNPSPTKEPADV